MTSRRAARQPELCPRLFETSAASISHTCHLATPQRSCRCVLGARDSVHSGRASPPSQLRPPPSAALKARPPPSPPLPVACLCDLGPRAVVGAVQGHAEDAQRRNVEHLGGRGVGAGRVHACKGGDHFWRTSRRQLQRTKQPLPPACFPSMLLQADDGLLPPFPPFPLVCSTSKKKDTATFSALMGQICVWFWGRLNVCVMGRRPRVLHDVATG